MRQLSDEKFAALFLIGGYALVVLGSIALVIILLVCSFLGKENEKIAQENKALEKGLREVIMKNAGTDRQEVKCEPEKP